MEFKFDYKQAAKLAVQFCAMGALFALALPPVFTALGFSAEFVDAKFHDFTPAYSATFFGTMGALHAFVREVVLNNIPFFNSDKEKSKDMSHEIELSIPPPLMSAGKVQQVNQVNQQSEVQVDKALERTRHVQIEHDGKIVSSRQLERT